MSVIVFAAPVAAEPPVHPPGPHPEYTYLWTGCDGVTWDLNNWQGGVYLASGVIGLGHAPIERWTQQSPSVPGNLFGGARTLERAVQLPVVITTQTTAESSWRDLCRRWWKGWSKDMPGTLTVIDSAGQSKRLLLRHNPDGQQSLDIDPGLQPWVPWMVNAIADQPYWRGDQITQSWGSPVQYQLFGDHVPLGAPGQLAPPITISSAATLAKATITNPGNVDAWLEWTLVGPFDAGWSITVNGGTITGPAIAAGAELVVSTDPTYPIATLDTNTDVSGQFTVWDPRPVAASSSGPISIGAVGQGTVTVAFEPLYEIGF